MMPRSLITTAAVLLLLLLIAHVTPALSLGVLNDGGALHATTTTTTIATTATEPLLGNLRRNQNSLGDDDRRQRRRRLAITSPPTFECSPTANEVNRTLYSNLLDSANVIALNAWGSYVIGAYKTTTSAQGYVALSTDSGNTWSAAVPAINNTEVISVFTDGQNLNGAFLKFTETDPITLDETDVLRSVVMDGSSWHDPQLAISSFSGTKPIVASRPGLVVIGYVGYSSSLVIKGLTGADKQWFVAFDENTALKSLIVSGGYDLATSDGYEFLACAVQTNVTCVRLVVDSTFAVNANSTLGIGMKDPFSISAQMALGALGGPTGRSYVMILHTLADKIEALFTADAGDTWSSGPSIEGTKVLWDYTFVPNVKPTNDVVARLLFRNASALDFLSIVTLTNVSGTVSWTSMAPLFPDTNTSRALIAGPRLAGNGLDVFYNSKSSDLIIYTCTEPVVYTGAGALSTGVLSSWSAAVAMISVVVVGRDSLTFDV